jgi:alkaline phosphatase
MVLIKRSCLLVSAATILFFAHPVFAAKNVILFVGDGMGPEIVTATRFYKDPTGKKELFLDSLPIVAHVRTPSSGEMVTDSAAAATAMATGIKTRNSCLGFGPACSKNNRLQNLGELLAPKGVKVGFVTTTRITHATPAGFYAQQTDRDDEDLIAKQLLTSPVALAFGGGQKYFSDFDVEKAGYTLITDRKGLADLKPGQKAIGLFSKSHIPYVLDRKKDGYNGPSLPEMTKAVIELLSNDGNGYFLMVEGGRIDHAAHVNRAKTLFEETLEFDEAVRTGVQMTTGTDTLILVTADHDTAGISLNGYAPLGADLFGMAGRTPSGEPYPMLTWATGPGSNANVLPMDPHDRSNEAAHTGTDVTLYMLGGDRYIIKKGTIDNTEIFRIIFDHLAGGEK